MSTVEEIVQAVKELPREKWDEVKRGLVRLWLSSDRPDLAKGINSIAVSRNDASTLPQRRSQPRHPPIQIKGKPISETLIEDRR
jgi:hypothetical protein